MANVIAMNVEQETLSHISNCTVSYQIVSDEGIFKRSSGIYLSENTVLTAKHGLTDDTEYIVINHNEGDVYAKRCIPSADYDLALLKFEGVLSSEFATCSGQPIKTREAVFLNSFLNINPKTSTYEVGYEPSEGNLKGSFCLSGEGIDVQNLKLYDDAAYLGPQDLNLVRNLLPFNLPVRPSDSGSGIFNIKGELVSIAVGALPLEGVDIMDCSDGELVQNEKYASWGVPLEHIQEFLEYNL